MVFLRTNSKPALMAGFLSQLVRFYLCNFSPTCVLCFVYICCHRICVFGVPHYISCHRICITIMEARTGTFLAPTGIASSTRYLIHFHIIHLVLIHLIHFIFLPTSLRVVFLLSVLYIPETGKVLWFFLQKFPLSIYALSPRADDVFPTRLASLPKQRKKIICPGAP